MKNFAVSGFALATLIRPTDAQNNMTCTYSTPYPVPDSSQFYLYDGVDFTFHCNYELNAGLESLTVSKYVGELNRLDLLHSFDVNDCILDFENRCSSLTMSCSGRCYSNEFNLTVTSYDSSVDIAQYLFRLVMTFPEAGPESLVNLTGL